MTYGGLLTTRSKCSPSTGSSRLPWRNSMPSIPFSAALNAANESARGFTSVATTCSLCRAASSAWTPLPVPTSSARRPGRRTVSAASRVAGGLMPVTCSGSGAVPASCRRSAANHSSPCGTMRTPRMQLAAVLGDASGFDQRVDRGPSQRVGDGSHAARPAQREQPRSPRPAGTGAMRKPAFVDRPDRPASRADPRHRRARHAARRPSNPALRAIGKLGHAGNDGRSGGCPFGQRTRIFHADSLPIRLSPALAFASGAFACAHRPASGRDDHGR